MIGRVPQIPSMYSGRCFLLSTERIGYDQSAIFLGRPQTTLSHTEERKRYQEIHICIKVQVCTGIGMCGRSGESRRSVYSPIKSNTSATQVFLLTAPLGCLPSTGSSPALRFTPVDGALSGGRIFPVVGSKGRVGWLVPIGGII